MNFGCSECMPQRKVSEAAMKRIFEPLGFTVVSFRDLTKTQMMHVFEEYQRKIHTGCFIFIILSHGKNGVVLTSDDQELRIEDIVDRFNSANCPTLQEKPSMFIFDVCRIRPDFTEEMSNPKSLDTDDFNLAEKHCSLRGDIAILYATATKDSSSLESEEGSRFTQLFENVICEGINKNMEFNAIMTALRNEFQLQGKDQTLEITATFTKHYHFKL